MAERRNLLLVGGVFHPVEDSGPALARALAGAGWRSEICEDVEAGLKRLAAGEFEQLTVACLRFSMTQHEKYAPFRERWALSLSAAGRAAIRDYLAAGKGLLAIHAAPISFDDWPKWEGLIGIGWRWGVSHHPPQAPLVARATSAPHAITRDLPSFEVADEIYSDIAVAPWMTPLLEARHADMPGWRPVAFAGESDGARRAYCALGHDGASLANPAHQRLIQRAALWTERRPMAA